MVPFHFVGEFLFGRCKRWTVVVLFLQYNLLEMSILFHLGVFGRGVEVGERGSVQVNVPNTYLKR